MTDPSRNGAAGLAGGPRTLELGGRVVVIERPTGLKASRGLAMLRALSRATPELQSDLAAFRGRYERENVLELDRVQAKLRHPPRPILDEETGAAILEEDGSPRMLPSPVDRLTEADWQAAGGVYRVPASPSGYEVAFAMLDRALELAEDVVYRFLALFTLGNGELAEARKAGRDEELIRETADRMLDESYADELLELAVAVGETVDQHFRRKADALGDRLEGFLNLLGLEWRPASSTPAPAEETATSTSTPPPSEERPSSSTDSPTSTPDGPPTPSSTPPTTSSSSSPSSPGETTSDEPSTTTTAAAA